MILPASHIMSAGKKQYGILNILIGSTALYTRSLLLLAQATGQVPSTQQYTNSNYITQSQSTGTPTHPHFVQIRTLHSHDVELGAASL